MRGSPRRMAGVGSVMVLAVIAGVAFGVVVTGESNPTTGSTSSMSPQPSTSASPVASSTESTAPSASAEESGTSEATGTPQATPLDTAAATGTPAATAGPATSEGGAVGGGFDITGEWDRLAPMPGATSMWTVDTVELPDGRIAVFRRDSGSDWSSDEDVVVYDRERDTWDVVTFTGARPRISSEDAFAVGVDGRLYTFNAIVEISGSSWTSEPIDLVPEWDDWSGSSLAAGGDGRIYRRARDTRQTELIAYDPATETFGRTASTRGRFDLVFGTPDGNLALFGYADGEVAIVTYDIETESWSSPVGNLGDDLDRWHVAVGSDRRAYLSSFDADAPELWAISLDDGTMHSVELPPAATGWAVDMVWTRDKHLFAFGRGGEAWRFSPDD